MTNKEIINTFGYNVQKLLIDKVNKGKESLTLYEIHHNGIVYHELWNNKLSYAMPKSLEDKLSKETIEEIHALWVWN